MDREFAKDPDFENQFAVTGTELDWFDNSFAREGSYLSVSNCFP